MNFFKKPTGGHYDDNYGSDAFYEADNQVSEEKVKESAAPELERTTASFGGVNLGGNIELKVVRPEKFESVSQIADHLLKNRTVVLNLEAASKDTARRLIDFLSGVAYSIDGQLKRVANNTYIITPNNVDVSDAGIRGERREMAQAEVAQAQSPVSEQMGSTRADTEHDALLHDLEY